MRSIHAKLDGKRVHAVRRGRTVRVRVDLRRFTKLTVRLPGQHPPAEREDVAATRVYHPCPRR